LARATLNTDTLLNLCYDGSDTERVIWVDPGESTGWALWGADGSFASGQDEAYVVENGIYAALMGSAWRYQVGWEQYLITGSRVRHDGSALRVIGFLEWVTRYTETRRLKPMPSSARNLGQDGDKLRVLGWHAPGRRDANAAAAHLLAHLLRDNLLPRPLLRKLADWGLSG